MKLITENFKLLSYYKLMEYLGISPRFQN